MTHMSLSSLDATCATAVLSWTQDNNTTSYIFEYIHYNHGFYHERTLRVRQGWLTDCKDQETVKVHPFTNHKLDGIRQVYANSRRKLYTERRKRKTQSIVKNHDRLKSKLETYYKKYMDFFSPACKGLYPSFQWSRSNITLPLVTLEASSYPKFWLKWKAALEHTSC